MKGSKKITGSKGSFVYTNSKGITMNVVDALMKLPNSSYKNKIDSL
jgi:hypothetical protein